MVYQRHPIHGFQYSLLSIGLFVGFVAVALVFVRGDVTALLVCVVVFVYYLAYLGRIRGSSRRWILAVVLTLCVLAWVIWVTSPPRNES